MGFEETRNSFKAFLHPVVHNASLWRCVETIPLIRAIVPPWQRTHPFDRLYGTDTSGHVPVDMLVSDKTLHSQISPYGGSQPSIIRRSLIALGNVEEYAFVDLGCGKGRPLIIASEFPFRSVSGVELSSGLVKIARRNIAIAKHRFPTWSTPAVIEGNAVTHLLPEGNLALYFYHAFHTELLSQLIKKLEETVACENSQLFFIYYNPVYGDSTGRISLVHSLVCREHRL